MKTFKLSSLVITGMAAAVMAWTSAAVAEDHGSCGTAPAAPAAKSEATAKTNADIIAQQKPSYPLTTCVVLGNKLGDEAVDYVYKGRLVRFCCPGCTATFEKDPQKYLSKIDAAKAKAKSKAETKTDSAAESPSAHSESRH